MAGSANNNNNQFNGAMYLSPGQQDLLMAALHSNNPNGQNIFGPGQDDRSLSNDQGQAFNIDAMNPAFFPSAQNSNFNLDGSPFGEFLDGDSGFDLDNTESDLMIGNLPGDSPQDEFDTELGDKRKNPDEDDEDFEGGGKRREGDDKTAKKPGRKPLTSEPTTKRKAQNRAAQRAFRERKEKHLKDLETKVTELEKASDAANHENGLLRAQVTRLQTELREYRKRLSSNSSSQSRSPPMTSFAAQVNASNTANSFQFEFPRFGGLPGAQMFNNGPLGKGNPTSPSKASPTAISTTGVGRQNSDSMSPRSQGPVNSPDKNGFSPSNGLSNGQRASLNDRAGSSDRQAQVNSTMPNGGINARQNSESKTLSSAAQVHSNLDSPNAPWRSLQYNATFTSSVTDSPSASSASHFGASSSADTSPEPSHNSPAKTATTQSPVASAHSNGAPTPATSNNPKTPNADNSGIDYLANQNGGQFDPLLFGDYRDSQTAIVGDGDFTGGFFNDAFPIQDFGSPFHFGDTPAVQKPNPLEEIEKLQDGIDEEVVPGEDTSQMLNCHKIWDKLSNRPEFQEGTFDIDGLCSELRAKARCSESGVVVDKKDVDAALSRTREN